MPDPALGAPPTPNSPITVEFFNRVQGEFTANDTNKNGWVDEGDTFTARRTFQNRLGEIKRGSTLASLKNDSVKRAFKGSLQQTQIKVRNALHIPEAPYERPPYLSLSRSAKEFPELPSYLYDRYGRDFGEWIVLSFDDVRADVKMGGMYGPSVQLRNFEVPAERGKAVIRGYRRVDTSDRYVRFSPHERRFRALSAAASYLTGKPNQMPLPVSLSQATELALKAKGWIIDANGVLVNNKFPDRKISLHMPLGLTLVHRRPDVSLGIPSWSLASSEEGNSLDIKRPVLPDAVLIMKADTGVFVFMFQETNVYGDRIFRTANFDAKTGKFTETSPKRLDQDSDHW